jgi:hypothetical protein
MKSGNICFLLFMIILGIDSNSQIVKFQIEMLSDKDKYLELHINRRFTK